MKLTHLIVDAAVVVAYRPLSIKTYPRTLATAAHALAHSDLEERPGGWLVRPSVERLLAAMTLPVICRVAPKDANAIQASPFLNDGRTGVTETLREVAEAAPDALILTSHREVKLSPHTGRGRWMAIPPLSFDYRYAQMVERRCIRGLV